jgi:hypothetical protein
LVLQAATRDMNPSVPQSYIDDHIADDPARAHAEYMAQFRSDLEGYVLRETVEACVQRDVFEIPPQPEAIGQYCGFLDPAGGSGKDAMTLCIAHVRHGSQTLVIDCLREARPPFSPEQVTKEFAAVCKSYGVASIVSDRVGLNWSVEMFAHEGVRVEQCAKPKTALYIGFLPLLNSLRVELLDHQRAVNQLLSLERSPSKIDHPVNQNDDLVNAIAGVADLLVSRYGSHDSSFQWVSGLDADDPKSEAARWQAQRFAAYVNSFSQPAVGIYNRPRSWTWR